MIGTDRSYEHRSYAVHRAHLQRVEPMQEPAFMVGQTGWRQALAVMAIVLVVVVVMVTR